MGNSNTIELLFVAGSSLDSKGRRVLVRESGGIENYIWPEDGITEIDVKLLGITEVDQKHIRKFFGTCSN